ncbi:MAG: histidine phosphatase family protein [Candidatus Thiodiazotropha sp. (ex. Lucinisca nassula)]|uniref:histidine phosphatase family protein n=1 Tax=Candidatus Thiodiazotropha sp. LNASS1 TaxID=3096260 RepID=UPI000D3512D2|nr:histidine phosphatase family protein [Candidatus Thiodiazotropha sp. (ex. Lucinisca nassula)]MBW9272686.1 histidine phosphatase family protein [Candidatus Thiodiazotropha sp. (ex. Lucinisca nassula)]PUB87960.1 MAG: histidine phosphatase family protein [gamma proteobacterium symbiont of Ctena orbiculata]PUB90368.1 MAG: histidine phosphatase family protein [gamma proteobacterium symbiont of Ctena orbiculata]
MADRVTRIDLLRHGEPVGGRRYRGQIDDPLSDRGWEQMWQAVSGGRPWQAIVSSPLRRCSEFATALGRELKIAVELDERLKEVGFGDWEGQTGDQLRMRDQAILSRFYHDPIQNRPQQAEDLNHFNERVLDAYSNACERFLGQHLLLVAHAGVIRSIINHTLQAPLNSMYRLSIATASLTRIRIDSERPPTLIFMGRSRL